MKLLKKHIGNMILILVIAVLTAIAFNVRVVQAQEMSDAHVERCIELMRRVPDLVEKRNEGYGFVSLKDFAVHEWPGEIETMEIIVLAVYRNQTATDLQLRRWTAIQCQKHGQHW